MLTHSNNPKTPQIRSFFYEKWLLFGAFSRPKVMLFHASMKRMTLGRLYHNIDGGEKVSVTSCVRLDCGVLPCKLYFIPHFMDCKYIDVEFSKKIQKITKSSFQEKRKMA